MNDDEPFVWKPCIPKNSGASGPINAFGPNNFVVLRKVSEMPRCTRAQLLTSLLMSDANALAALEKLLEQELVHEDQDQGLMITRAGAEKLENL